MGKRLKFLWAEMQRGGKVGTSMLLMPSLKQDLTRGFMARKDTMHIINGKMIRFF